MDKIHMQNFHFKATILPCEYIINKVEKYKDRVKCIYLIFYGHYDKIWQLDNLQDRLHFVMSFVWYFEGYISSEF